MYLLGKDEAANRILRFLGIDETLVRDVTISLPFDGLAEVTLTRLVEINEEGEEVLEEGRYRLVPVEAGGDAPER